MSEQRSGGFGGARGGGAARTCGDFRKGNCRFGVKCRFSHDDEDGAGGRPRLSAPAADLFAERRRLRELVHTQHMQGVWGRSPPPPPDDNAELKAATAALHLSDYQSAGRKRTSARSSSGSDSDSAGNSGAEHRAKKQGKHSKKHKHKKSKQKSKRSRRSDASASDSDTESLAHGTLTLPLKPPLAPLAGTGAHSSAGSAGEGLSGDDDDADIVGPLPPRAALAMQTKDFGKALLPGEGSAMAQYVEEGKRIPRRGEIGLSSDEIAAYEAQGFIMSGSRHRRMEAVRLRKENQIYTADERRVMVLASIDAKAKKETKILSEFRDLVAAKRGDTS